MGSKNEVAVFTETNLGTRIAIAVSPDIIARDFKSELEKAHIASFPELGNLTVRAMMVKQNSNFYRLPDLLPLKLACQGCKKFWSVHVNACLSKESQKYSVCDHLKVKKSSASINSKKRRLRRSWCLKALLQGLGLVGTAYAWRKRKKRKRRDLQKNILAGDNSERLEQEYIGSYGQISVPSKGEGDGWREVLDPEQVSESLSGGVSVSGIIDRYFSSLVDVDQIDSPWSPEVATRAGQSLSKEQQADAENTCSSILRTSKQHSVCRTSCRLLLSPLSEDLTSVGLRNKYERSEVGERLVMASNNVRLCQSGQRSSGSNLSKSKKFLEAHTDSISRSLVFEIGNDD